MKLALIGYGKMGRAIEGIARERGHEVVSIITSANQSDFESEAFRSADVAIEFSVPSAALNNVEKAIAAGVAVVSGTTGWTDSLPQIKKLCDEGNATFLHSSNFSIGVNAFFALNKFMARIMNRFPQYDVEMKEIHHIHKLDHPSGTAITLANGIIDNIDRKQSWSEQPADQSALRIEAVREGEVPGTHIVTYTSAEDRITLSHEAFSRRGFALGSVVAAEWICGKKGWFTMNDIFDF